MNDFYSNFQNSTKAAIALAEINTKAFTEIVNNQVGLLNEVLDASLSQAKKVQSSKDFGLVVEEGKKFSTELEGKARKVLNANLKVIEDSSKKAYEVFSQSTSQVVAAPTSSK